MNAQLDRRGFLKGALALGVSVPLGHLFTTAGTGNVAALADTVPLHPWSMAMHVHACFSEGTASMEAQLDQAALNGVDVVWWTEHEFRMTASGARQAIHFNGLTESENGTSWTWAAASSGSFAERSAAFVSSPVSPSDPVGTSALRLVGRSSGTGFATHRLNGAQTNSLFRTCLAGMSLELDVLPQTVGSNGYLALYVTSSQRPAGGGQSAGSYALEYRIGGDRAAGSRVASGRTGIVTLAAPTGSWTTLSVDPVQDMAQLWPWFDGRDSSLYAIGVGVGSRQNFRTDVVVDHLRFNRSLTNPEQVVGLQRELMDAYAPRFPSVTQYAGLEWSMLREHVNWFGPNVSLPPPTSPPWVANSTAAGMHAATARIHEAGGLASHNHPFGNGVGSLASQSTQNSLRRAKATELISSRVYGCDILEVGLPTKGGVSMDGYLGLWDALSRNGIFVTGTGVSDDHSGKNWLNQVTNFFTWAWAANTEMPSLLAAIGSGKAYFGNPSVWRGQLDLLVDGYVAMGEVTIGQAATRTVRIVATQLPTGSTVELVRGVVDYAGSGVPDPQTTTTVLSAGAFSGAGSVDINVDTASECFVRATVRSSSGAVVACSNPIWLLRDVPVAGIPLGRRAADQVDPAPHASFTWTLAGSTAAFDASASTGSSPLVTYAWDFGDGVTSEGVSTQHEFADGTYTVALTVTDEVGLTDTTSHEVTVSTAPAPVIEFVGANRSNANTKLASVTVPSNVVPGDGLLLFITWNTTQRTVTSPAGWTTLSERIVGSQTSRLLRRTAQQGDAASAVPVAIGGGFAKVAVELLAYRGVAAGGFATASSATQSSSATHPTPTSNVNTAGSWAVSYWVDKSNGTTTSWNPPVGVSVRGTSFGSGGGAIGTLSADSGTALLAGSYGNLVAVANSVASTAITWTVILSP